MSAKSCRKIEVLGTADRILGAMQDSRDPLSISELVRLTGFSTDTVFRQVGTMEDLRHRRPKRTLAGGWTLRGTSEAP